MRAKVVRALFQEWSDVNAFYNIPHCGKSAPFPIRRAILQGITEAGEAANASIADLLAPLVATWCTKGFGFKLLGSGTVWTHVIRSDNVWLFAKSAWEMQQMLTDMTIAILLAGWDWKTSPKSTLQILYSGSLSVCKDNIVVDLATINYEWQRVEFLDALGSIIDGRASTRPHLDHRLYKGESIYWKHVKSFRRSGCNVLKFFAWLTNCQNAAAFGISGIHLTKDVASEIWTWEVQQLRRAMCLKPKNSTELFVFRSRSKTYITDLFRKSKRRALHHRALLGFFDMLTDSRHPVSNITADRDDFGGTPSKISRRRPAGLSMQSGPLLVDALRLRIL